MRYQSHSAGQILYVLRAVLLNQLPHNDEERTMFKSNQSNIYVVCRQLAGVRRLTFQYL